eukprot:CAMPEP_0176222714 /NCGR_PEP_ID=MMETSP0121_2-20121125/20377_1 /TAXON_ID=160619 /ORGANISM="Kryptoperidinium foliaceum, Strain CCMP 1326" /LENGTH=126 /DNA_ID=CAMNT_0017561937 /DNA_START=74 /DNA_END=454 /DNA_ORIENTATION=+
MVLLLAGIGLSSLCFGAFVVANLAAGLSLHRSGCPRRQRPKCSPSTTKPETSASPAPDEVSLDTKDAVVGPQDTRPSRASLLECHGAHTELHGWAAAAEGLLTASSSFSDLMEWACDDDRVADSRC